jgi:multiple sugar transport system substrate-binding protein
LSEYLVAMVMWEMLNHIIHNWKKIIKILYRKVLKVTKKTFSRRDFLKTAAAASGVFAFGFAGAERGVAFAQDETLLTFGFTWDAAFRPVQEEFNENFIDENPGIAIEANYSTWADHNTTVPVWAAAGTLPDIIYVHGSRVAPWTAEGITSSIQAFVDADPEFNVEGIWEEALRLYRVDGELVGIPYDHGPLILGYNKDIFDNAGMDYPNEDWTMDDLRETAIALTDADNLVWGWSGEFDLGAGGAGAFLGGWGGATMNEDETQMVVDSDEAKEAMNFWYTLIHDEGAGPDAADAESFGGLNGPWIQGLCAMAVVPSWETPGLARDASFGWDVTAWPEGPVQRKTGAFGSGFSITSTSENRDAAWSFMRAYLSKEGMETVWGITGRGSPAREAAYESWMGSADAPEGAGFYLSALKDYAVTGGPFQSLAAPEVLDVLGRQAELMRLGDASVDDAVATIMDEAQAALDAL